MQKLIYITNARIPTEKAHGYQICKMCEEFSSAGLEVELWVPTRRNSIKKNVFDYYALKTNFKIKYIRCFDFVRFNKILFIRSFYFQMLFFLLSLIFKKIERNTVVYTRDILVAMFYSVRGYKTIFEAHSWPASKEWLYIKILKRADKIVVVNNHLKKLFINKGFKDNEIIVAHDGVDIKKFDINVTKEEAKKEFNLPRYKYILGYTGSLKTMGQDKGVKIILESLKKLVIKRKDVLFVSVGGSDSDINYYVKMAHGLNVSEYCKFVNRVSLDKLSVFQKSCDILLMPFPDIKHYRYYMSPLKMFEYMASKRPIIASSLPSLLEIMNNKNCVLVRPDDVEDLADKIEKVITNKINIKELTINAYNRVLHFSWEERAKKIINEI